MKRIVAVILTLVLLLPLYSCDPMPYNFDYQELKQEVIGIELIEYDQPKTKHYTFNMGSFIIKPLPFDEGRATILETLDEDEYDDFLRQLSEENILYKWYSYNSPKDICLRLIYENGNFLVLSCDYANESFHGYVGSYNSEGEVLEYYGSFEGFSSYERLVNEFFSLHI